MVAESEAIYRHRAHYLELGRNPNISPDSPEKGQIEGALNSDKTSFTANLPVDISREDFMLRLGETNLATDATTLGSDYVEQMTCAVLYPSVLAPYPATFASVAIAGIVDMFASSDQEKLFDPTADLLFTDEVVDRTGYLAERMLQLGVIEHSHEDRFLITPKKKQKLEIILNKFD